MTSAQKRSAPIDSGSDSEQGADKKMRTRYEHSYLWIDLMHLLTVYRPQDSDWSEVFTVLVGKEETSFTLHKTAYCQSSSYFKGALSRGWKENEDGVVRLAHADSRDFRIYVDYVYGRGLNDEHIDTQFVAAIDVDGGATDTQIAENDLILRYKINRLCRLWVLGDYLGDPDFQNEAIDNLSTTHSKTPAMMSSSTCVPRR